VQQRRFRLRDIVADQAKAQYGTFGGGSWIADVRHGALRSTDLSMALGHVDNTLTQECG
jgi:hypothetical protein